MLEPPGETVTRVANWTLDREGPADYMARETVTRAADWTLGQEVPTGYEAGEGVAGVAPHIPGRVLVHRAGTETNPGRESQHHPTLTTEVNEWLSMARSSVNQTLTETTPVVAEDF